MSDPREESPPRCIVCGTDTKQRVVAFKDRLAFVHLCEDARWCQARAAAEYIDLHYEVTTDPEAAP